eukprot:4235588-Prymnesium_polylepis.3
MTRWYLHGDLEIDCDSNEYAEMLRVAYAFVIVWPVGGSSTGTQTSGLSLSGGLTAVSNLAVTVPLLYGSLLFMSRHALRRGISTPLTRATSFLTGDYKPNAFWWEPLEMCRKLTLTGDSTEAQTEATRRIREEEHVDAKLFPAGCLPIALCHACWRPGWVLLVDEEFEQARVLVALLLSSKPAAVEPALVFCRVV